MFELQFDFLTRIFHFDGRNRRCCAGRTHLVTALEPTPNWHANNHSDVPNACEFPLETVINIRIRQQITARQRDLRQIGRPNQFRALFAQFHGVFQHLQLGAILESRLVADIFHRGRVGQNVLALVGQFNFARQRQSAKLTEQHFRQREPVIDLRHLHIGLVHLHIDLQTRCASGNALVDHLVDIVVELLHEVAIAVRQFLLLTQRNHRPIHIVDVLQRRFHHAFLLVGDELLVDVGHSVGCRDGTAHVNRLSKHHRGREHVPRVGLEGIDDFLSELIA